ncbi:MAG: DUF3791 domain-containing protein [Treponema sp.]|nr:DUF3791 domain-containing protein [Treponema sp.]
MDKVLHFKIFCLENYKATHKLTGKAAYDIFLKHGVFNYITDFFDILHSFGLLYLINDIDEFISNRQNKTEPHE